MRVRTTWLVAIVLALAGSAGLAEAGGPRQLAAPAGAAPLRRAPRLRRATDPSLALGARLAEGGIKGRGVKLAIGTRSIALPATARVRVLPAETFEAVEQALVVHQQTIDANGLPLEAAQLRGLRAAAEQSIGRLPKSKVVVYPMSGYDAGSAIHLFPDATTIIGLDNHPFVPPGDTRSKIPYAKVGMVNFAYYGDVDRLGHVGPALIGALTHAVPGFHLRGVTLIENDDLAEVRRGAWGHEPVPASGSAPAVHAIIEFDSGPGTTVRRYVHINASLVAGAAVEQTWWWKAIDKLGPQAVLLKAAEHVFDAERGMARALRPAVLGWLQRSAGVLIEDKDRYGKYSSAAFSELVNRPEPTGTGARSYHNWMPSYPGARSARLPLEKFHFGYAASGEAIFLTVFDRPSSAPAEARP